MTSTIRGLAAAVLVLALGFASPARADYEFEMQSGKKIVILGKGPARSPDGSTLLTAYRTALVDRNALRDEADELFRHLAVDARRVKVPRIEIRAEGPSGGTVSRFEIRDRDWRYLESPERTAAGLDEGFVRALYARFDRAYLANMQPVITSYLGGEWTLNVSDRPQMNRIDYLWNVLGSLDAVTDRAHRREFLEIVVAPDRRTARVESREFERGTYNRVTTEITAHASDIVELRDNVATIARSSKKIDSRIETRAR
jgi:hypothetical protein